MDGLQFLAASIVRDLKRHPEEGMPRINDRRVIVDAGVDVAALARVLAILARR